MGQKEDSANTWPVAAIRNSVGVKHWLLGALQGMLWQWAFMVLEILCFLVPIWHTCISNFDIRRSLSASGSRRERYDGSYKNRSTGGLYSMTNERVTDISNIKYKYHCHKQPDCVSNTGD